MASDTLSSGSLDGSPASCDVVDSGIYRLPLPGGGTGFSFVCCECKERVNVDLTDPPPDLKVPAKVAASCPRCGTPNVLY
jgi:hypothetical protein